MVNGKPNLEQNSLSKKIEESEKQVPKPENLSITNEGLESLRERTQYRIKSKTGASMQQGRENLGASVDRLKGTPAEKAEGQERLKPVEAKIISLGDAYQQRISAKLEAEGIGLSAIPDVQIQETQPVEKAVQAPEIVAKAVEQPAFAEDKLREGLKLQGVPADIAEQIISQEKAKVLKSQESSVSAKPEMVEPKAEPKTRAEEVKAHYAEVKADVKARTEAAKAELTAKAEVKKEAAPKAQSEKITPPPLRDLEGDEKKVAKTEVMENQQAQKLESLQMDMKKNLDAWSELIGGQTMNAGTSPEKQGRINKFFNKIRNLTDRAEKLINNILERNAIAAMIRMLTQEGRQQFLNKQVGKIAETIKGEKAEEKAKPAVGPKFEAKKLQAYLESMGVPKDLAEEIIQQEKKQVQKIESQGKRKDYAKEAARRLKDLERKIVYQATSAHDQIKDIKKDFGKFKTEVQNVMKKAGSTWKKMNLTESLSSQFQSYLNKADTLMITEAERRAIRNQQKRIEAERKQTLKTVERQAQARRKQEAAAKEAAHKKAQKEAAAKAKQEKLRADAQKKAAKDLAKAQKNLSKAQQEVARAENKKKSMDAAAAARQAKEQDSTQKKAEQKQRAEQVKAHYKEVGEDVKARAATAKEQVQADAEKKKQETASSAKPKIEEMPPASAKTEGGEQLYGREAQGYEELAKEMAAKEPTKIEVKTEAPAEKKPEEKFKQAA